MRRSFLYAVVFALASLLLTGNEALAQEEYATRYELGLQFSQLARLNPESQTSRFSLLPPGRENDPGFGGRFTYNLRHNLAFEAEVNSFPRELRDIRMPAGRFLQGQFGVKAGKRFKRFGLFGKLRPGFIRFTKVSQFTGSHEVVRNTPIGEVHIQVPEFRLDEETYSSVDLGGVMEFYPSRRIVVRLDLGDTIIRYGAFQDPIGDICAIGSGLCGIPSLFERPPETKHNLQFSAGVAFRF